VDNAGATRFSAAELPALKERRSMPELWWKRSSTLRRRVLDYIKTLRVKH
jgi:hypothetical protein